MRWTRRWRCCASSATRCSEREIDHGPIGAGTRVHGPLSAQPPRGGCRACTSRARGTANPCARSPRWRASSEAWSTGPLSRESAYAARLNEPLADHDVLLTPVTPAPPPRIGAREGLGWLWTSLAASAIVSYAACWNFTGQPACSVPAGFAAEWPAARGAADRAAERRGDAGRARRADRGRAPLGAGSSARLLVSEQDELLEVAVEAARMAGELLSERVRAGRERTVSSKSTPTDLVSEADLAVGAGDQGAARRAATGRRLRGRGGRRGAGNERPELGGRSARRDRELPVRDPPVVRERGRAGSRGDGGGRGV